MNKLIAEIAQSVEHFTRNEGVVGSSPIFSLKNMDGYRVLELCGYSYNKDYSKLSKEFDSRNEGI